jgi:ribulose-phosphate 3-epimerase
MFADAGASYITFHPEASQHVDRSLQLVRDLGCKAGLVLNPATNLDAVNWVMDRLDMLLLMSGESWVWRSKIYSVNLR